MADIPRLPQGTTAFQKGKELFDKDLAKWKVSDIRIVGVEKVRSFASATAYFAENSEEMRVIVLKRRRFRHLDFASLGQTKILVDRRFADRGYLD